MNIKAERRTEPGRRTGGTLLRDDVAGARLKGIALMVLAVTLFSVLDASAKLASHHIPIIEVVWFRYALHFLIAALLLNPFVSPASWRVGRWWPQVVRSIVLTSVTALNFLALRYLQLDETVTIAFLGPLIVAGLSVVFLREKIGPRRLAAIVVGFCGILVVTRPGFGAVHWAVIFSLGSVLCYSIYAILTRALAASESPGSMLLVMAGVPTIGLLPVLPSVWVQPQEPLVWGLLLITGIAGGLGHFCVILASRYAPASVLAPFIYAQILSMVALGYLIFGDVPTWWTLLGAAIVIASGLYLLHRERVVKNRPEQA